MKYAIVNCDIYTGEHVLYDKAIIINDDRIENLVELDKVPRDLETVDTGGMNIAPGFIDVQVNGGGGKLFTDEPTEECVSAIYNAHNHCGTTNFLPTFISGSYEKMLQAISTIRTLVDHQEFGVLGLHFEGPFLNESKGGVHDKKQIRKISNEELDALLQKGKGIIKILTVAPELVEEEHIRKMKEYGILVSAGHTNATYEQIVRSFHQGISSVTHLFNAMSQMTSREPGVVGASLNNEETWAGIIADGFHVDFACVRISKRVKGRKLILVTDAMPPVGSAVPSFRLGDLDISCTDGRCVTKDGVLAGSVLDMATAVRNCVQKVGIPLDESLRMASTYPAEFLGVSNELGKIKAGCLANMVVFDNQLCVRGVVTNGKYEHHSPDEIIKGKNICTST
jgi:N-acetylglucosamine-6-phosphate deacetylase